MSMDYCVRSTDRHTVTSVVTTRRPNNVNTTGSIEAGQENRTLQSSHSAYSVAVRLRSASKSVNNHRWFESEQPAYNEHCRQLQKYPMSDGMRDNDGSRSVSSDGESTATDIDIRDDDDDDSDEDEFADFRWLEQVDGQIAFMDLTGGGDRRVGCCSGKLIRRSEMVSFYDDMEEPTRDTSALAFDLFDRYGQLRSEFIDHPIKKGSGVWGTELDSGDLFLLDHILIEKQHRGKGLGRKIVTAMLDKAHDLSSDFFAMVMPGCMTSDLREETKGMGEEEAVAVQKALCQAATSFWRSLGFRRVGASNWLALASDMDHPSFDVSPRDDFDLPDHPKRIQEPPADDLFKGVATASDADWLASIEQLASDDSREGTGLNMIDENGNTLLHVAALHERVESLEWLTAHDSTMLARRNYAGETPLDALQFRLERERIVHGDSPILFRAHISDEFEGYGERATNCLCLLRGIKAPSPSQILRLKYGCTCGCCYAGFLSPRMRADLLSQADMQYHFFRSDISDGFSFVSLSEEELFFIDSAVRRRLRSSKSVRRTFVVACLAFYKCLERIDSLGVPSVAAVVSCLRTGPYYERYGLPSGDIDDIVSSVGTMMFTATMNQIESGSGMGMAEPSYTDLPKCRNDEEVGFVSGMCGYKRVGPYRLVSVRTGLPIDEG